MKITLPTAQIAVLVDRIFSTEWYTFFDTLFKRILGKFDVFLGGVLLNDTTSTGSVGAGSDLISYSLSANTLSTTGDYLEVEAFGIFAANANNKSISLVFGSTTVYTIAPTAINGGSWSVKAKIIRTAGNTQEIIVEGNGTNAVLIKTVYTAGAENLATGLTVKVSATGVANNDVVQKNLTIKVYSQ